MKKEVGRRGAGGEEEGGEGKRGEESKGRGGEKQVSPRSSRTRVCLVPSDPQQCMFQRK